MKERRGSAWPGFRAMALLIGSLAVFLACSVSSVSYLAPGEVNRLPEKTSVIVELRDGCSLTLLQPRLQDGQLSGMVDVKQNGMHVQSRRSVAVQDIQWVKIVARRASFAFIPAAAAAAWLIVGATNAPSPPPSESCPFVYSWDGRQFVFEAEPYGGAICQGLQRSEWCRLDWLRSVDHAYRIRVANELDETQYTDEVKLIVVDHEPGRRIAPDVSGGLHDFGPPLPPVSARDEYGQDIRPLVSANDPLFWESSGDAEVLKRKGSLRHELIFTFPKPVGARRAKLLANVWTSQWGAEIPRQFLTTLGGERAGFFREVNALGPAWQKLMSWFVSEELYLLRIQVKTSQGWSPRGILQGGGPFMANDKAYILDIADIPGDTLELKLSPPVTFWRINRLSIDYSPDSPLKIQELAPRQAVNQEGQDVTSLFQAADREYAISPRTADWTDLYFHAPPRDPNRERSFILKINGYYDIHLADNGASRRELSERFLNERDFTIRYALDAFIRRRGRR